jgi:hypothetical protein
MIKNKVTFMIALACLSVLGSCKKDSSESSTAKTLNKSTFAPKTWYNQGSSIVHIFSPNGVYSNTGTWAWKNNSDTLEIAVNKGGPKTYWKVYWNTDTEMSCQRAGTPNQELYKTHSW